MPSITIRISGAIPYEETTEVSEAEAYPVFRKLKDVLGLTEKAKRGKKRSAEEAAEAEGSATSDPTE